MSNTQTDSFETAKVIDAKTGETWWFVSLGDDSWLGVTEDPRGGSVEEVRQLFQPSNGFRRMTAGTRFLHMIGKPEFYGA